MPLLPQGPPIGGGLAMPPPQDPMGGAGLMAPPPDLPPAALAGMAMDPLVAQQMQQLQALKAQQAQETMAVAMQAIAALPNPDAMAAQSEPSGLVPGDAGVGDPSLQGGY